MSGGIAPSVKSSDAMSLLAYKPFFNLLFRSTAYPTISRPLYERSKIFKSSGLKPCNPREKYAYFLTSSIWHDVKRTNGDTGANGYSTFLRINSFVTHDRNPLNCGDGLRFCSS